MYHLFEGRTGSRPPRAAGSRSRRRLLPFVVAVGLLAAACGADAPPTDDDGRITVIPPDGTYTATTCTAIGHEFGKQLNDQVLAIIDANRATPGNASDPLSTAIIRLMQGANDHLHALGLAEACDLPEFLAATDEELTPQLRAMVGEFATTPVVTFEEWRQYLIGQITIIDIGESPSAS